jgi:hypothetical protein
VFHRKVRATEDGQGDVSRHFSLGVIGQACSGVFEWPCAGAGTGTCPYQHLHVNRHWLRAKRCSWNAIVIRKPGHVRVTACRVSTASACDTPVGGTPVVVFQPWGQAFRSCPTYRKGQPRDVAQPLPLPCILADPEGKRSGPRSLGREMRSCRGTRWRPGSCPDSGHPLIIALLKTGETPDPPSLFPSAVAKSKPVQVNLCFTRAIARDSHSILTSRRASTRSFATRQAITAAMPEKVAGVVGTLRR